MMYLDDTLTEQETRDAAIEQRYLTHRVHNHDPAFNPHGISWKGEADPRLIVAGDMIAIYAGNDFPSFTVTVESKTEDYAMASTAGVTFQTTGGEYFVPAGMKVWVAAYAPLLDD